MKLQHRSGLFDDEGNEYYLEYTESPFKLVCKHLQNHPDVDITYKWARLMVNNNIKEGSWIECSFDLCPICDEGKLYPKIGTENAEYKGVVESVEYHFSECDVCGAVVAGSEESIFNKQTINAFYNKVDGDNV